MAVDANASCIGLWSTVPPCVCFHGQAASVSAQQVTTICPAVLSDLQRLDIPAIEDDQGVRGIFDERDER
jgi:hypothetical protein